MLTQEMQICCLRYFTSIAHQLVLQLLPIAKELVWQHKGVSFVNQRISTCLSMWGSGKCYSTDTYFIPFFLMFSSDCSWIIANLTADGIQPVQIHALTSSCIGPYAAIHIAQCVQKHCAMCQTICFQKHYLACHHYSCSW